MRGRQRNVQPKNAKNFPAPSSQTERGASATATRPKEDKAQPRSQILLTAIASCAAVVSVIFAGWQTFIARDAFVAGQRAFVHLEGNEYGIADNWVSDSECKGEACVYNIPRNEGKMIRSKFSFTNAGNTPTKATKIFISCKLVDLGTKVRDPFDFLQRGTAINRTIGAKQTITISEIDSCNFKNKDILLNVQMHTVPVFLLGEVTYEDWIKPGMPHRTQFSLRLVVNDPGGNDFSGMSLTAVPEGTHNCMDDDCPK